MRYSYYNDLLPISFGTVLIPSGEHEVHFGRHYAPLPGTLDVNNHSVDTYTEKPHVFLYTNECKSNGMKRGKYQHTKVPQLSPPQFIIQNHVVRQKCPGQK